MKKNVHGGDIYTHKGVIDFSANINPLGIPENVIKAAENGIRDSVHYPDVSYYALRTAIAEQENLLSNEILCGNGAADVIFSLIRAINPKKALILAPTFAEYETALKTVCCEIRYYDLKEKEEFKAQKNILEYITEELDIVFLCNPNNPTGQLTDKGLLKQITEQCKKTGTYVVIDECFNDFLENGEAYTMKEELENNSYLVLLKAFTKLYAMPGLRLGYCMSSNCALLDKIKESTQPWNISIPAEQAGIAALKEKQYVQKTKSLIKKEKEYLQQEMKAMGYKLYGSKANYIFFRGTDTLYEDCLNENLLIRDCSNYRGLEKGYYRIAVKSHEDNVKMIECLRKYMPKDIQD